MNGLLAESMDEATGQYSEKRSQGLVYYLYLSIGYFG